MWRSFGEFFADFRPSIPGKMAARNFTVSIFHSAPNEVLCFTAVALGAGGPTSPVIAFSLYLPAATHGPEAFTPA